MALTPPSGEDRSTRRGIGSLPESTEIATFVPATGEDSSLFYDAYREAIREGVRPANWNAYAYERTGVFPAPFADGQLVREISDADAQLREEVLGSGRSEFLLSEILDHPELFERYPALSDVPVVMDETLPETTLGNFNPFTGKMLLNPNRPEDESLLDTILHEAAGHGVQTLTGMPPGSNRAISGAISSMIRDDYPGYENIYRQESAALDLELAERSLRNNLAMADFYREEYEKGAPDFYLEEASRHRAEAAQEQARIDEILSSFLSPDAPTFYERLPVDPFSLFDLYRATGGEAAARLIESRSDMTEEELRQNYPLGMLDVSPESIEFLLPYQERLGLYDPMERYYRDPAAGFEGDNQ